MGEKINQESFDALEKLEHKINSSNEIVESFNVNLKETREYTDECTHKEEMEALQNHYPLYIPLPVH